MRVLICGDRNWTDRRTIDIKITELLALNQGDLVIIHGAAKGADSLAGEIAKEYDVKVEAYPAQWTKYGRGAGPIRNQQMIDEGGPDLVIAFHTDLRSSKGTKDMIKRAIRHQIPYELVDLK